MKKSLLLIVALSIYLAGTAQQVIPQQYKQPVFTQNLGQITDESGAQVPDVLAKTSIPGLDLYITKTGLTYVFMRYEDDLTAKPHPVYFNEKKTKTYYSRVDMNLAGSTINMSQVELVNEVGWKSNYYNGQTAVKGMQHFKQLTIKNAYPNIDWVWKVNSTGQLEYDFIVHPGGDASLIKMKYSYADITPFEDHLLIASHNGTLIEGTLKATNNSTDVKIRYNYNSESKEVSFNTATYDHSKDLVIDPPLALQWSAQYSGAFTDGLRGVVTDTFDNVYLTGYVTGNNFPLLNPSAPYHAYYDSTFNGNVDAVVFKIDSNQTLLWSTYLGGPGNDFGNSITTDVAGNVYVTGAAEAGFPLLSLSGAYNQNTSNAQDAIICKFNTDLSLAWSTYYGGNGNEEGLKILTDDRNFLYVSGYTNSPGGAFPTQNAGGYYQNTVIGDEAFILKFNQSGQRVWGTVYGGAGNDYATSLAVDDLHNLIVTGYTTSSNFPVSPTNGAYYLQSGLGGNADGFILGFNDATIRNSATYYGGTGNDYFTDVALGRNGNLVFTGRTSSTNFHTVAAGGLSYNVNTLTGNYDAFIVQCNTNLNVIWSTYYGGTGADAGTGIVCDKNGRIFVTGFTFSADLPLDSATYPGAYFQRYNRGNADGFIAGFSALDVMFWSTYKGDSCYEYPADIAYDTKANRLYVCGEGLLGCNRSLPDTGTGNHGSGGAEYGFCWGFAEGADAGGGGGLPDCFTAVITSSGAPCPNQCNGLATLDVSGVFSPFTITWSDGETGLSAHSLCEGPSYVSIQDASGCVDQLIVDLTPLTAGLLKTGIGCSPNFGTAYAFANNGTPPYSFVWTGGSTGNFIDSIMMPTGVSVVVTDANNCTAFASDYVDWENYPDPYTIYEIQPPTCYGNNNESNNGILYATHDSLVQNIVWNVDSFGHSYTIVADTIFNVGFNVHYQIGVSYCVDGQKFTNEQEYFNDIAHALEISGTPSTNCTLGTGYVLAGIIPSNDNIIPYTYLWSTGGILAHIDSILPGPYSVTVTDHAGCTASISYTVPQIDSVVIFNITPADISSPYCALDSTGEIGCPLVTGVAEPYSYQWSTGAHTCFLENVPIGTYSLTVTNYNGCSAVQNDIHVGGNNSYLIEFSTTPEACGGTLVVGTLLDSIGTAPYNYVWSNGGGTNEQYGLPGGEITFNVFDANSNIIASSCIIVPDVPAPYFEADVQAGIYDCITGNTATVNVYGGTAPYSYAWSNGDATDVATQPSNGELSVIVSDAYGCRALDTIVTQIAPPFVASYTADSIVCNGNIVNVYIDATGGFAPYTGAGTYEQNAGTATYYVSDNGGCSASMDVTLLQPDPLQLNITSTPIICGGDNSLVTITGTGGSLPFTGDGQYNYPAGTYDIILTDANGCSTDQLYEIDGPQPLTADISLLHSATCATDTVTATAISTGGTGAIYYTWSSGETTGNITVLNSGNINLQVTDDNGCTASNSTNIQISDPFSATYQAGIISCNGASATVNITASGGLLPYTGDGSFVQNAGAQAYLITDDAGCSTQLVVTLQQPDSLQITVAATPILCNGGVSVVTVAATGGLSPYTGTGAINMQAGAQYITVTDANGCITGNNLNITQPDALANSFTVDHHSNCVTDTVQVTSNVSGGTGAYSYVWSNGGNAATVNQYSNTTLGLQVTDDNGCSLTDNIAVQVAAAFAASYTAGTILCNGGSGAIHVVATGGIQPYTGTGNFTQPAGMQVYTVTDSLGCSANLQVTLQEPSALLISESYTPVICYGGFSTVTVTAAGGTGPYTGTGSHPISAGSQLVIVRDANGCSASTAFTIPQPDPITITADIPDTTICLHDTIYIKVNAFGGTAPYIGAGYAAFTQNGINHIRVTDNNGCVLDSTFILDAVNCDSLTGIANVNSAIGIDLYPNPAADKFFVHFNTTSNQLTTLRMYTAEGKLVSADKITQSADLMEIDCATLASGVYLIEVSIDDRQFYRKLVLTR